MAESTAAKPQYQHFVPQFLLRNFSHPYKPEGPRKRVKPKHDKGPRRNEDVVSTLDLTAEPPTICEKPVKRVLGLMNMYQDTTQPAEQQQYLEQMFSKLEDQASRVFRKITKAFEDKKEGIWITRDERNLVRKFLFLLKYRGKGYHRRFDHETPAGYSENDKELFREYMADNGFERPLDVWFNNLKTIMELDMDLEGKWVRELPKRMYHEDAMGFFIHTEFSYMAICTPANANEEFILTDNSYNIFEGPNHFGKDKDTGKVEGNAYTPLHEFAPVHPKLMIILRADIFPNPIDDEQTKAARALNRRLVLDDVYPYEVKSLLADLPITKAQNSYSRIVNGRLEMTVSQECWKREKDHRFFFTFFPVGSKHVNTINAILLDNSAPCTNLVFNSKETFAKTLEWYLTAPCTVGKRVIEGQNDEKFIKRLEVASRSLGSEEKTVWEKIYLPGQFGFENYLKRHTEMRSQYWKWVLKRDQNSNPDEVEDMEMPDLSFLRVYDAFWDLNIPNMEEFFQLYESLGGSRGTLAKDFDQVWRMARLRVKLDSWSSGIVAEPIRHRNRNLLIQAYVRLPPQRIVLYVKHMRATIPTEEYRSYLETGNLTHHVISPEKLGKLIHDVGVADIQRKWKPDLKMWGEIDMTPGAFPMYDAILNLALEQPGFIRDCGILEIESLARQVQRDILKNKLHEQIGIKVRSLFEEGQVIELMTRAFVRPKFMAALEGKLEKLLLRDLKKVFFELAFPTPPVGWKA
ncbi:hypothetical protein B0T25DRAFT_187195 [Lasiosphaeria hispida]|uniref:DUF4238 domain-containing protein n=1 Tax=Lasiosphaeria hispida TaxID=260671 RepID=A0AAJ0MDW3_9PEZI|nr:hypothetical protein B0T25DRAFT_187195 [Lasiosphaeria hispida]